MKDSNVNYEAEQAHTFSTGEGGSEAISNDNDEELGNNRRPKPAKVDEVVKIVRNLFDVPPVNVRMHSVAWGKKEIELSAVESIFSEFPGCCDARTSTQLNSAALFQHCCSALLLTALFQVTTVTRSVQLVPPVRKQQIVWWVMLNFSILKPVCLCAMRQ